jgi:hypothetical protein
MQYINPFSILEIPINDGEFDSRILKRTKKRLLTEFELQGTTTIILNGHEMDKNAILKVFQQLEHSNLSTYHLMIAKQPLLNNFLEKGDLLLFQEKDWYLSTFNNKGVGYVSFLQPYFSEQFNRHFSKSLGKNNSSNFQLLCQASHFLLDEYKGGCFKNTYRTLMEVVNKLEYLVQKGYLIEKNIRPFIMDSFIKKMNLLPDYFIDIRVRIGRELEELALKVNNQYEKTKFAKKILRKGLALKTNEGTRYQLQYVLDQLNGKPEKTWGYGEPTDKEGFMNSFNFHYGWIFIGIFLVRIIFLFVSDSRSTDDYTLDFNEKFINTWEQQAKEDKALANNKELVQKLIEHHADVSATNIYDYETKELKAGENPFFGIPDLNRFTKTSNIEPAYEREFSIQEITNKSPWDVILIYETDLITCAEYLPKDEVIELHLEKGYGKLTAYAGEDWRRNFPLNNQYKGAFVKSHGIIPLPVGLFNNSSNTEKHFFRYKVLIEKRDNSEIVRISSKLTYFNN